MGENSSLLRPIEIGGLTLKNRIMFPPLTTGYEERDGSIGARSLDFYTRLAKGGVGYIVIGDVAPVMTATPTPKIYDDSQIPGFRKLADSLHEYNCRVALQLFHPEYDVQAVGRIIGQSRKLFAEAQQAKESGDMELAAQKTAEAQRVGRESYAKIDYDMEHYVSEVSLDELSRIREAFSQAARRANEAGIDAIEVHGDRMIGSLCSTVLNHRNDEYGGSLDNRARFALEVVSAMKNAAPEMMIEYKLPIITKKEDGSPRGKGGLEPDEAVAFAKMLEKAGVHMIQVAQANHTGNMADTIPPMGTRDCCWLSDTCKKIKSAVNIPVAIVGKVVSVENGEKLIEDGIADVVAYGRSLLCDPDIAVKIERSEPIRKCLNCNRGCVDAIMNRRYISCVLNAENGEEGSVSIKPCGEHNKIVIVGAGLAGLEAARVAAIRGHQVDVYEKDDRIGGQLLMAAVPPRKAETLLALEYYNSVLPSLNVHIHTGTEATTDIMNAADAVIAAVGASNALLSVEGADTAPVVSSWDVLSGKTVLHGHCAVIGGGLVGIETAEYLSEQGCQVSLIMRSDKRKQVLSSTIFPTVMAEFEKNGVKQYVNAPLQRIAPDGGKVYVLLEDKELEIVCDYVVAAVGSVPNELCTDGVTVPVIYAGPGNRGFFEAIRAGYNAANQI